MRTITGDILIPSDCLVTKGAALLIEVRDVSRVDALSTVIAQTRLTHINFEPGDRISFTLSVPEVTDAQSLNLRIHISFSGSNDIRSGDLLTTISYPIPSRGFVENISVLVRRI
jgi:hypothetical protein